MSNDLFPEHSHAPEPATTLAASSESNRAEAKTGLEAGLSLPRFAPSFGWLALFFFVFFAAVMFYAIGYGVILGLEYAAQGITNPDQQDIHQRMQEHLGNPSGMVGMYLFQCLMLIPLVFFAAHFTRQSCLQTLAFNRFRVSVLGFWLAVLAVFLAAEFVLMRSLSIDPGNFLRQLSGSKHLPFALVVIFCAPLLEELIFRGYLFKAWRHSRLGLSGTLLLTSGLFTALHISQYNWMILAMIFVLSIILGLAREKSGSLWVPIILHAINNLVAAITVIYFGWL